jgi:chromate transporter
MPHGAFARYWKEIAASFLKLGATAYGGPAITGVIQAEIQEKRQWVSTTHFLEGMALTNLLPGAGLVQLSTFLGHARGGWWGGVLAGLCFVLPGLGIMLALTLTYAHLGATPIMRSGLDGLGPVVVGIYVVAVYRLGRAAVTTLSQLLIALTAAAALACSALGVVAMLALAAGGGIWLWHSRRLGTVVLLGLLTLLALREGLLGFPGVLLPAGALAVARTAPASLPELGLFFFKAGAVTFGGGMGILTLIQDQVVQQWHWLTPQEFLDGLALGQCTPGPVLVVTAYIGYKLAGLGGAGVAALASFAPSFLFMLVLLPIFDRVRTLGWIAAAMRGVRPAVSGMFAVTLARMAPPALPDLWACVLLVAAVSALVVWRMGAIKLMLAGAMVGVLRSRLSTLRGVKAALAISL